MPKHKKIISIKYILFSCIICSFVFVCIESLLKVTGFSFYPNDLRFVLSEDYKVFMPDRGKRFYATNPRKSGIFVEQSFAVNKAKHAYRIFILGGSSINYLKHFDALKDKLETARPDKVFEIINAGGLSYGTNRLLLVFQEILEYQPDLIILYSGHNEFEEECLKTEFKKTVFTRLNESLVSFRLYQLASKIHYTIRSFWFTSYAAARNRQIINPVFPPDTRVTWGRSFNERDKRLIYENYLYNIETMARIAKDKSINLIISTVAYNQIGTPPFYSFRYGTFGNFKKQAVPRLIEKSLHESTQDPFCEYAIGEFFYQKENFPEAKKHLEDAFILDAQPHRANRIINAMVRRTAIQYNVPLIDMEERILASSTGSVASLKLFSDHCHLNEKGQLILLDGFYEAIKKILKTG